MVVMLGRLCFPRGRCSVTTRTNKFVAIVLALVTLVGGYGLAVSPYDVYQETSIGFLHANPDASAAIHEGVTPGGIHFYYVYMYGHLVDEYHNAHRFSYPGICAEMTLVDLTWDEQIDRRVVTFNNEEDAPINTETYGYSLVYPEQIGNLFEITITIYDTDDLETRVALGSISTTQYVNCKATAHWFSE
jgi:hypothetical protein